MTLEKIMLEATEDKRDDCSYPYDEDVEAIEKFEQEESENVLESDRNDFIYNLLRQ